MNSAASQQGTAKASEEVAGTSRAVQSTDPAKRTQTANERNPMNVIQEAADIIQRAMIEKKNALEATKATYRARMLADDSRPGDAEELVKALEALGLSIGDAYADARAIAARQKLLPQIDAAEKEAARVGAEGEKLTAVIAGIVRESRDPRRADETIGRQRELRMAADQSGHDARRLRDEVRKPEQAAPRIFGGKW